MPSTMIKEDTQPRAQFAPLSIHELLVRAQQAGGLSLAALLVVGAILILFSVNIVTSDEIYRSGSGRNMNGATMIVFRFGSQLGVQPWLAVLGVAFGLLSFGMDRSFTHLFDSWSSYRANKAPGLNYARYLNTQPHSPVLLGVRGFGGAIIIRNVILALGIVASAGYSFAVVDVAVDTYQHLNETFITLLPPPLDGLLEAGMTSLWFGDAPLSNENRAFTHQQDYWYRASLHANKSDIRRAPKQVVMVGWADCSETFNSLDKGILYTREIVLVAKKVQDTVQPAISMTADASGWLRVENVGSTWTQINSTGGGRGVVDYRAPKEGRVEIQWAEMGNWLRNNTAKQPVIRKVTFDIQLGVAIVRRIVTGRDCSIISDEDGSSLAAQIVTTSKASVKVEAYQQDLHFTSNWIMAILLSDSAGPREGVSVLIRAVMATWTAGKLVGTDKTLGSYLGHAPPDMPQDPQIRDTSQRQVNPGSSWFNEKAYNKSSINYPISSLFDFPASLHNSATNTARSYNVSAKYPVYAGTRSTGQTRSYYSIIYLFIFLGVFSYLLLAFRIYLGPAEVTSRMGQHVYLAGLGAKVPKEATDHLACGRNAAMESALGRVRVKSNEPLSKSQYISTLPIPPISRQFHRGRWVNNL